MTRIYYCLTTLLDQDPSSPGVLDGPPIIQRHRFQLLVEDVELNGRSMLEWQGSKSELLFGHPDVYRKAVNVFAYCDPKDKRRVRQIEKEWRKKKAKV